MKLPQIFIGYFDYGNKYALEVNGRIWLCWKFRYAR